MTLLTPTEALAEAKGIMDGTLYSARAMNHREFSSAGYCDETTWSNYDAVQLCLKTLKEIGENTPMKRFIRFLGL